MQLFVFGLQNNTLKRAPSVVLVRIDPSNRLQDENESPDASQLQLYLSNAMQQRQVDQVECNATTAAG